MFSEKRVKITFVALGIFFLEVLLVIVSCLPSAANLEAIEWAAAHPDTVYVLSKDGTYLRKSEVTATQPKLNAPALAEQDLHTKN